MSLGLPQAMAAPLAAGTILKIDPGVFSCIAGLGTPPTNCTIGTNVATGSYFAMDANGNGVLNPNEKTPLAPGPDGGVIMGRTQSASGSHIGKPNGSEHAGIDAPWAYFGNTGMDYTTIAPTVLTNNGTGTLTLNWKGWTVTWNGIVAIPMGGDKADYPTPPAAYPTADSGTATLTCSTPACANGDTFTLDSYAHVPKGSPSNFGGVLYGVHLVGTIVIPPPPVVTSSVGTVSPGATAVGEGLSKPLMTKAQLASAKVPSDPGVAAGTMCSGGCFDFKNTGVTAGATAKVVLTLNAGIPKNAVFRKYNTTKKAWSTFDTSKGDSVASASLTGGVCPAPGAAAYTSGLTSGDRCVELGIKDGGPNDMSSTAGVIADPSGVGVLPSVTGTGGSLAAGTILKIDPGVVTCLADLGTPPDNCTYGTNVAKGSYFAMDMNGNGVFQATEKTPLAPGPDGGVIMGRTQSASGSHNGKPNGSEQPGIDAPWSFFGNTGLDYTTIAPSVLTNKGAGVLTLNWKGWTVTWNGIAAIPMGGDKADNPTPPALYPTADSGTAALTCSTPACANGDTFTLDSYAHVPKGSPSGFGGVFYDVHLVGTIVIPSPRTVRSSVGTVSPGITAAGQGLSKSLMTKAQLASAGVPSDPGVAAGTMCSGGCFDFKDTGVIAGATAKIVLPLNAGIPKNAVFRKYNPTTSAWSTFDTSKGDWVKSAPLTGGACPAPGATAYTSGLTIGNYCVELGIKDGGPNDMSSTAGVIADPSGVGVLPSVTGTGVTLRSGTGGCSISPTPVSAWRGGAWWLTGGLLGWLGFSRRRRASRPS
jgi:hypothetical protein